MKSAVAARYGITKISDLRRYPGLRFGFREPFMARNDGWEGLRRTYQLPQTQVRGLNHYLAYRGLESGDIHVMNAYATDGEIAYYDLRVLEDDLHYFPQYYPLIMYRADLAERMPQVMSVFRKLVEELSISEDEMRRMNGAETLDRVPKRKIAADSLARKLNIRTKTLEIITLFDSLYRLTIQHLVLVGIPLCAAIVLVIPLSRTNHASRPTNTDFLGHHPRVSAYKFGLLMDSRLIAPLPPAWIRRMW